MRVPDWPIHTEKSIDYLRQVLESPQWGGFHPMVGDFEQRFSHYQQCSHGIAMMNGTVTLETALQAADIGCDDEVIVPSISFISTATAVSRVGATPVFVDIEPYSFNMDPVSVERALSPRTKAIIIVHFGGPFADMDRLLAIAKGRGLIVIEDAAHAHGSEWRGQRAGTLGHAASFSFQNSKVLTAGEGGMVTLNDDTYAARIRSIANQGRLPGHSFFTHFEMGSNLRISALQVAVLMAQLDLLDEQIEMRTRNAALLFSVLQDVEGIHWQQVPEAVNRNCWYLVLGRVEAALLGANRQAFCEALGRQRIPVTPFYPHTLFENPLYQRIPCRVMECPVAKACVEDAFWMPHRVLLGDAETTLAIADGIRQAVRQAQITSTASV